MNLAAQLLECYRRLRYTSAPPTAVTTRLTSFLNTTHRQLLGLPGLDSLRHGAPPITFASVNGQAYYGLPPVVARVEAITDRTTMRCLRLLETIDIRRGDPGLVTNGITDSYVVRGLQETAVQPAAATGLWAVSTSAGDVQNVFIETTRTGGYRNVGAAVVMNGVTRVALGALTDHIEVTKFFLSTAAVGTVSLYDAAVAGNELARIAIGQTYARYLSIELYPTPTSAITYYVDYVRTIPDMVQGTDEPLLPEDFHWVIVEGAMCKEYTQLDDTRLSTAKQEYARGVGALKYFVNCPPDFLPSRRMRRPRASRFGAYFPATRE